MSTTDLVQIPLSMWGAMFALIAAMTVFLGRHGSKRRSYVLAAMLLVDAIMLFSDGYGIALQGNVSEFASFAIRLCNFFVFACIPVLAYLMTVYITALASNKFHQASNVWVVISSVICIIHFAIAAISPVFDFLYYFDEFNVYHRTNNYIVASALAGLELILLCAMTVHYRNRITRYERYSIMAYLLLPFATNLVQLFNYGLILNNLAITTSLLLMFLTHEVQKSRKIVQQEKELMENRIKVSEQQAQLAQLDAELAEKRIQVSISQMQPHFAFNALGSIEQLCRTDPTKAALATHHFAQYLRRNLRTLSSPELASFSSEMQHVRTYLWLEKMRFGEDVQFREEIRVSDFNLPSLTIQPLVENAIKHGMMDSEEGTLTVWVRTAESSDSYFVTVEDNGCGFDMERVDRDPKAHVGLANVQERIQLMQGGEVRVDSAPGKGTRVTIRIPKLNP